MKTKILCALLFISAMASKLHAQNYNTRFSPGLIHWLNSATTRNDHSKGIYAKINNTCYLSALIKTNASLDEHRLNELGVRIGTKAGNIWTVSIPENQMVAFTQVAGIDFIELDVPIKPLTDSVRYVTGVDALHNGIQIPMPLSGKGVVVGVVDIGFDFTHPAFYDTLYKHSRIKRVWDQSSNAGTPPAGYVYGTEFKDTTSILAQQNSSLTQDHGTSTSTITGGSGYGSKNNNQFRGIAYECDFVLVHKGFDWPEIRSMSITRLVDAFNYIFTYAQSVGKPAVINVSLGGWTGPHDGTSLFAQACNNLSGAGKVLVFACGNNGQSKLHLQHTFTPTDTVMSSIVTMPLDENYFELWGDTGKSFCIELGLFKNGVMGAKTQRFCIDTQLHTTYLIGTDLDTSYLTVVSNINVLNHKPVMTVEVKHHTKDSFYVSVYGENGTVHVWDEDWGDFIGKGSWAKEGDSRYTISEMACATSIISVSSFASRTSWKNLQNQTFNVDTGIVKSNGNIVLTSSIGPTVDGRMKPDIAAPGCMVGSATNSFSPTFKPGGVFSGLAVTKYISPKNNRTYYYAVTQGTSISAPVATGIVALMLQVNPNLSYEKIKEILSKTAIKDSITTATPDSTRWGAGKINAFAAIKETLLTAGRIDIPKSELHIPLYPNPNEGRFSLRFDAPQSGHFFIEVTNEIGQVVYTDLWELTEGMNNKTLSLTETNKGLHFITITGKGGHLVKKVIVQ